MSDNVIPLNGLIYHDESPDIVLTKAKSWGMSCCVVVGQTETGELTFGGTTSEMKDMLWLLQRAIWFLGRQEEELGS